MEHLGHYQYANLNARARLLTNCTVPDDHLCPVTSSYYFYRVDLAANAAFLAIFALSLIGYLGVFAFTRRALAFTLAMSAGVFLDVLGYVGRIMSWKNQWSENGFLIQICCLTIAPAFMAAGIYLCLRRIVYAFGPENSRIKPEMYTRIFIPCDLFSLLLQATGGGLASTATHQGKSPDTGDNIMVAGLALQVVTLFIFMGLCLDFFFRTRSRYNSLGEAAFDQNPVWVKVRNSKKFKSFLVALTLATICIFWRSVYRVAELAEGWTGYLIRQQNLFIAFEGVMVVVACVALNFAHPALCFREGVEGLGGLGSSWRLRKQKKVEEEAVKEAQEVNSGGSSDIGEQPQATEKGVTI